jgi:hypothetical protein
VPLPEEKIRASEGEIMLNLLAMKKAIQHLSVNTVRDLVIGKVAFSKVLTLDNAKEAVTRSNEIMGLIAMLSDDQIIKIRQQSWPE